MAFHFSAMQVSEKEIDCQLQIGFYCGCCSACACQRCQLPSTDDDPIAATCQSCLFPLLNGGRGKIISNIASSIIGLDFNILWLNNSPKNFCSLCAKFATPTRTTTTTEREKSLATLAQPIPNMAPIGAANKAAQQTVKIPTGRNPNECSFPLYSFQACLCSCLCLSLSCGAGDRRQKGVVEVRNFFLGITVYKGSMFSLWG